MDVGLGAFMCKTHELVSNSFFACITDTHIEGHNRMSAIDSEAL